MRRKAERKLEWAFFWGLKNIIGDWWSSHCLSFFRNISGLFCALAQAWLLNIQMMGQMWFFFRSLLLTLEWRTSEEGQVICALIIIRKSGPTAMFDPKKRDARSECPFRRAIIALSVLLLPSVPTPCPFKVRTSTQRIMEPAIAKVRALMEVCFRACE